MQGIDDEFIFDKNDLRYLIDELYLYSKLCKDRNKEIAV